jgi:hypothetical protein
MSGVTESLARDREFHITIGVGPQGDLNLENDLRLIKAALLYADHATLYSLTTSAIFSILAVGQLDERRQLDLLESVIPVLKPGPEGEELVASIRGLRPVLFGKRLARGQVFAQARFMERLRRHRDQMRVTAEGVAEKAGALGVLSALQTNLLEVRMFNAGDTAAAVREFVDVMGRTVDDPSTYPLFDDQTGNLVRLGIAEGKMTPSAAAVARGRHSTLAANLLQRLPTLDGASVDELIDIRRELERPLVAFRGGILRFSEDVSSAAWDDDFLAEAQVVFDRDVLPAVREIEEQVASNAYLRALLRKVSAKESMVVPAGSGLALALSAASAIPAIATVAAGVATVAAAGTAAGLAYDEWRRERTRIEHNQMFFYYGAAKRYSIAMPDGDGQGTPRLALPALTGPGCPSHPLWHAP